MLDDNLPQSLRCAAAKSLGQLDYRDPSNVNAGPLLKGLGQVALSACRGEMQRLQDYAATQTTGQPEVRPGGFAGDGNPAAEPKEDPVIRLSRGNLKYQLLCVRQGLLGVERLAKADEQKTVTAMKAEVESILSGLDDDPASMTPTDLLNKIGPSATRLEQVVNAAAA